MKEVKGWAKLYRTVEVKDDATEEEIKQALADSLNYYYFSVVEPEDITIEK